MATASRPETVDFVRAMGADHVVDHREPLPARLAALGLTPRWVAALTGTAGHWDALTELVAPRGHIAVIDDPEALDVRRLKPKALTFTWEFMFTRPIFETADMEAQGRLLARVAELVDAGRVRTTLTTTLGPLSAATLREAHRLQESGRAIGKTVLSV